MNLSEISAVRRYTFPTTTMQSIAFLPTILSFGYGWIKYLISSAFVERVLLLTAKCSPNNRTINGYLGFIYYIRMARPSTTDVERYELAQRAVDFLSKRERASAQPVSGESLISCLIVSALIAEQFEMAAQYAEKLLAATCRYPAKDATQARHICHIALGLYAEHLGDRKKAIGHLLRAANVRGSTTVRVYGPNMLLAEALLRRGEVSAVVRYLQLCALVWTLPDGPQTLTKWINQIKSGDVPDFGIAILRW